MCWLLAGRARLYRPLTMVQYGDHLQSHVYRPWAEKYLPYDKLKQGIKRVVAAQVSLSVAQRGRATSKLGQESLVLQEKEWVEREVQSIRVTLDSYRDSIDTHFVDVMKQIMQEKVELRSALLERKATNKPAAPKLAWLNVNTDKARAAAAVGDGGGDGGGGGGGDGGVPSAWAEASPATHRRAAAERAEESIAEAAVASTFVEQSKVTSMSARDMWKAASKAATKAVLSHRDVSKHIHDLVKTQTRLYDFAALNYNAFYKILKKFRKKTGMDVFDTYLLTVEECLFVEHLLADRSTGAITQPDDDSSAALVVDSHERRQVRSGSDCIVCWCWCWCWWQQSVGIRDDVVGSVVGSVAGRRSFLPCRA